MAHNRYHFRLCAFCNIISLLRIPRLIAAQNKEDFSALISKVSSTMKVTLEINADKTNTGIGKIVLFFIPIFLLSIYKHRKF